MEVLKGKTKIPELSEIDLAEAIEVKGIRAMGNRLTPHEVKEIELLASASEEEEERIIEAPSAPEPEPETPGLHTATPVSSLARDIDIEEEGEEETEIVQEELKEADESLQKEDLVKDQVPEASPGQEGESEPAKEEEHKPVKKIDFEITNPEDLDIDDKGQLGLF